MLQEYGQYIVADPKICHGKLTFRGTRIFVSDVLDNVADGLDWDDINRKWNNSFTREAIADAVRYAKEAFVNQGKSQQTTEEALAA